MTKKEIVRKICERANKEKLMKGNLTQLASVDTTTGAVTLKGLLPAKIDAIAGIP